MTLSNNDTVPVRPAAVVELPHHCLVLAFRNGHAKVQLGGFASQMSAGDSVELRISVSGGPRAAVSCVDIVGRLMRFLQDLLAFRDHPNLLCSPMIGGRSNDIYVVAIPFLVKARSEKQRFHECTEDGCRLGHGP